MRRAIYYLAPPLVCLAVFWRVFFIWFRTDDFAWLGLPQDVHGVSSFFYALFHPYAQGTVRVLSDRLFFLILSSVFGIWAAPFRVCVLLTWFAVLTLANAIGTRLTGSRLAGVAAAILWTTSHVLVVPLVWASAYNQTLCALFLLAALYARIRWLDSGERRWRIAEWVAYLLGFGALEITVMYPAVALLYTRCLAKRRDTGVFALFILAAIFSVAHFLLIPKSAAADIYRITVDSRLPLTALRYLKLVLAPEYFPFRNILGVAFAGFLIWRLWRRDRLVLFCVAWFFVFLVPVLPLPNHVSTYYLTIPLVGLAWLGGWGLAAAWRTNWIAGVTSTIIAVLFMAGSIREINNTTAWWLDRTSRMRATVRGAEEIADAYPGTAIIFKDVGNELFQTGFQDRPFRLLGIKRVYLSPGDEDGIVSRADLGGVSSFRISPDDSLRLVVSHQARVLEITDGPPLDITARFETAMRAGFAASHRNLVDVGDPRYASVLGPGWYAAENGSRWMAKSATVRLAAPGAAGARLYVTGYGPGAALASGPVKLRFRAGAKDIGSAMVSEPDQKFAFEFRLPDEVVNQYSMDVSVEASKSFRPPDDSRDLAMIFGTFEVR